MAKPKKAHKGDIVHFQLQCCAFFAPSTTETERCY